MFLIDLVLLANKKEVAQDFYNRATSQTEF